jgi:hypothetical protein
VGKIQEKPTFVALLLKTDGQDRDCSPLAYNSEKPEELLAEDGIIQHYKLAIPENNIEIMPVDEVFK